MKPRYFLALPPIALLAACGGNATDQTATTTNTGNVILNDAQANYSFENDAILNTAADDAAAMNAVDGDANGAMPANGM